jgi:hypothetical protein
MLVNNELFEPRWRTAHDFEGGIKIYDIIPHPAAPIDYKSRGSHRFHSTAPASRRRKRVMSAISS